MKQILFLSFLIIFFSLLAPARAVAQIAEGDISVSTNPASPGPYQNVLISLSSFSTDLNRADIRWYVGDNLKLSGTGKKEWNVTTGAVGSVTVVTIKITLRDSTTLEKTVVLAPSEVDLLYEALDSYVPPFYRGKALPAKEALIRITAMPNLKINGAAAAASDLVYSWKENYDPLPDDSGYAKNALTFRGSYLHPSEGVSVQVSSLSSGSSAEGSIVIPPISPKIVLYANTPALGTNWRSALNNGFLFPDSEMGVVAAPYFFSPKNPNAQELRYAWALNGTTITTPVNKNLLVLRKNPEDVGVAKVSIGIENLIRLFQGAAVSATVTLTQ